MAICHRWKQASFLKEEEEEEEEEEDGAVVARSHSQTLWKLFQEDLNTAQRSLSPSRSRPASFSDASCGNSCGNGGYGDEDDEEEDDSMLELEDEEAFFLSPLSNNDSSVNKPPNRQDHHRRCLVGQDSVELFPPINDRQAEIARTLHRSCESINQMIRMIVENAWNSRQKTTVAAAELLARREETTNCHSASIILPTSSSPSRSPSPSPSSSLSSSSSTSHRHCKQKSCGGVAFPSSPPAIAFRINKNKHSNSATITKMAIVKGNPEEMDRLWQDYNDAFPDHSTAPAPPPPPPPPCNLLRQSDSPSTSKPSIDQGSISNRVKNTLEESHSARADSIPLQIITHAHNLLHQSDSPSANPSSIEQNSISSRIKKKSKDSSSTGADSIPQVIMRSCHLRQSDSPSMKPSTDQNSASDRTEEKAEELHSVRADPIRSQIIAHACDLLHPSDSPSTVNPSIGQDSILNRIKKKSKELHSKRAHSIQSQITTTAHVHHQFDFLPRIELSVNQDSISNRIKERSKESHSMRADSVQSQIVTTSCDLHQSDILSTINLISVDQDSISNRIKERSKESHGTSRADSIQSQITTSTAFDHRRSDFPSAIELSINRDSASSRIKKSSEESHSKGIRLDSIRSQILTTTYDLHHQSDLPLLADHCKNKSRSNRIAIKTSTAAGDLFPAFPSISKIKTKKKSQAAASSPSLQGKKVIVIGAYWGRSRLHGLGKRFRKCFPNPS